MKIGYSSSKSLPAEGFTGKDTVKSAVIKNYFEVQEMQKKTTVLIVEDEILVAENIRNILVKNGYDVSSIAVSGNEAINYVDNDRPDVILMDIVLKGDMDGIEAAEKIRMTSDSPIIFLTAHSDGKSLQRAKTTEPFGYLTKPFEERQLIISIEMALYKAMIDREKEDLIKKLREALDKVKVLSGLLPICSYCKKIRDDKGYWEKVEDYIRSHTGVEFTHSICPECIKKYFPDLPQD